MQSKVGPSLACVRLAPALRGLFDIVGDCGGRARGRRMRRRVIDFGRQPQGVSDPRQRGDRLGDPAPTLEGELGVTVGLNDVKAFHEGTVGRAAGHGYSEMGGKRIPVRLTAVLREEDGDWKAVQSHASIGVPNDQMLDPIRSLRRRKLPVAAISRV